ncbi:MAG: universal stress protein [Actinomycetes bacterium]
MMSHGGPFRRVLVGWDGSVDARLALATAVDLVPEHGEVLVLGVVVPHRHAETDGGQRRGVEADRERMEQEFARVAPRHPGVEVRLEVVVADAGVGSAMLDVARRRQLDLMVIGRSGADPSLTRQGGALATFLVQNGTIPVLVVPRRVTV